MTSPAENSTPRSLDLDILESDPAPLFVIKTGETVLDFEFQFRNQAIRELSCCDAILAQDKAALLFRSWAQALGKFNPHHEFSGRIWSAEKAGKSGNWKIVRASGLVSEKEEHQNNAGTAQPSRRASLPAVERSPIYRGSKVELSADVHDRRAALLQKLPSTNLNARWVGIQTMMEMSDVGVFEYNTEGKLLHGNDAWYRLRYVHNKATMVQT